MRNLFKISALPVFILALSLGGIACGSDDGKGGENAGGDGGSENPGGTGGTDTTPPTGIEAVCEHWYAEGCAGFSLNSAGGDPVQVSKEECPSKIGQDWSQEKIDCMLGVECSQAGIDTCFPPPEPTQECDDFCDHFYVDCGGQLYYKDGGEVSLDDCKRSCPSQGFSSTVFECLLAIDCSEPLSSEEAGQAFGACTSGG